MARVKDWTPLGLIPAVLLPFGGDFSIDAPAYRAHLREVAAVRGISALTVNGTLPRRMPSSTCTIA